MNTAAGGPPAATRPALSTAGSFTPTDGATQADGNGAFTFADGTGTYDSDAGALSAAFEGAVNFKGHESDGTYGLDLTLSDLRAKLDDGSGELTADVDTLGEKSDDVVLAELKAASGVLSVKDDVITLDDVTATLTEAGAEAFGGFYTAGTELDPVDLSVAVSEDRQLPGGNGGSGTGGSGGSGSAGGSGSTGTTGGAGTTGPTTGGVGGGGRGSRRRGAQAARAGLTAPAGAGAETEAEAWTEARGGLRDRRPLHAWVSTGLAVRSAGDRRSYDVQCPRD
ncbi:hypothetical protein GFH48_28645 [Streptomyces fagopyri]|uniref:Htaa domain-containing protein n=1 Tax=Streptomyces fagopyri TaxID=2662397 RepID=A0A5Q0LHY6_9ACTN|nr:HtaA domain-containing protein [Streptomyces fagopyri]QFZ76700.1 hypothetical protein GFH48_28645 [Streptomyces fagopyri]